MSTCKSFYWACVSLAFLTAATSFWDISVNFLNCFCAIVCLLTNVLPTPKAADPEVTNSAALFKPIPPVGMIEICGNGALTALM